MRPVCGVVWGLLGVGPGWSFGPYAGRLAPSDWAIDWAGFGPVWFGGVDWPRVLLGLAHAIGPGLIGRGGSFAGVGPVCWGRLAGVCSDWGGLVGP